MRSRYCAYKLHLAKYIIKTTHKQNVDYKSNTLEWEEEILDFCHSCSFEKLEIKEYIDGSVEAFVTFRATTLCDTKDYSFTEKSKFKKEFNKWYYFSGCFLDNL